MTYRSDSTHYYRGNNDNASSQYSQANRDHQTSYYDRNSTSYYDRTPTNAESAPRRDYNIEASQDAWAPPKRSIPLNDYHDSSTFRNPYDRLSQAEDLLHTRGFNAARQTYQRAIDEADGISLRSIKQDRQNDMQNLKSINDRESRLVNAGVPFERLQLLENQRQQILGNEKELNNLYYAPVNARISMGLACIKTGEPMEIMEGQRLIAEAKQKRPEIADDPRLQNLIDNAYQIGYRNHHPNVRPQVSYNYEPTRSEYPQAASTRTDYPLQPQRVPQDQPVQQPTAPAQRPPWQPSDTPPPVVPQFRPDPPVPRAADTQPMVQPPVRTHAEVPPPPGQPNDGSKPTRAIIDNSASRISDPEALTWLHNHFQHLTVEQKAQNDRDAQKAYDETPSSWNYFAPDWASRALTNKQAKLLEFSNGFRADLNNLFDLSKQPHSYESDYARQALITIIKSSAENMSDEAGNRQISEECCAQVKELCRAGANGRAEMVDAIRVGLTESSHLPSGAKTYLIDGLELLATDRPPAITTETAGRLALLALKHELDNSPRLGSPDRKGETRDEITQRQIRLIELIDKFGLKSALTDLQDLVKSNADDTVRQAAAKAVNDLQRRQF
ncbi:MAG: hypothetical protein JST89_13125 [Cyanobacteria bacterium SZAS-4]|nr:hypothetical protein [Cyanobacteria bacterium SZAS-4]